MPALLETLSERWLLVWGLGWKGSLEFCHCNFFFFIKVRRTVQLQEMRIELSPTVWSDENTSHQYTYFHHILIYISFNINVHVLQCQWVFKLLFYFMRKLKEKSKNVNFCWSKDVSIFFTISYKIYFFQLFVHINQLRLQLKFWAYKVFFILFFSYL